MDKKNKNRRISILKPAENGGDASDRDKKVTNTRRVSFSRQKVIKEYQPSGVGISDASFQLDMNLTPSTDGGNNTGAVANLNLTPESSSGSNTTATLFSMGNVSADGGSAPSGNNRNTRKSVGCNSTAALFENTEVPSEGGVGSGRNPRKSIGCNSTAALFEDTEVPMEGGVGSGRNPRKSIGCNSTAALFEDTEVPMEGAAGSSCNPRKSVGCNSTAALFENNDALTGGGSNRNPRKSVGCNSTAALFNLTDVPTDNMRSPLNLIEPLAGGIRSPLAYVNESLSETMNLFKQNIAPVPCRIKIRRSLDLNRSYPNVDLLANLSRDDKNLMDVTPGIVNIRASDTLVLSVNRNAREPTYSESMFLEESVNSVKSSASASIKEEETVNFPKQEVDESMDVSDHEVDEKLNESVSVQPFGYDVTGDTLGLSKIQTPDTLISIEASTFLGDRESQTAEQIRAYASSKSSLRNDEINGNEAASASVVSAPAIPVKVYAPVNLDVDPAWVEVVVDAIKPCRDDHMDTKNVKKSVARKLLNTLKKDVRLLANDYETKLEKVRQRDEHLATVYENLDVSVLGEDIYALCEHERFYVQHEWFNMAADTNKAHLEQIQDRIRKVEEQENDAKLQQATISSLPDLKERFSELTERSKLYNMLEQGNADEIIANAAQAPASREKRHSTRIQLFDRQKQYWQDFFNKLKQDEKKFDDQVSEIQEMIRRSEREENTLLEEINKTLKFAEDQGFVEKENCEPDDVNESMDMDC